MNANISHPNPPKQYKKFRRGMCYVASFEVVKANPDWTLVHGVVLGQGGNALGLRYGHAWLEKDGWVYDPISLFMMPKDVYYAGGHVGYTKSYTAKEARKMMRQFGHYGSWDPEIVAAAHKPESVSVSQEKQ